MAALPPLAHGALLVPQGVSGELGYDYRHSRYEGGYESTSNMLTGQVNSNAYLWQPWFVTMGLSLAVSREQSSSSGGVDSSSNITTGAFNMNALPQSHFPFTAIYTVSDSRIDTSTTNDNPLLSQSTARQFSRNTLQLTQGYKGKRYTLNFRYNNDEAKSDGGERYLQEGYGVDYRVGLPKQNISVTTFFSTQSNNQNSNESDSAVVALNHNYYPSSYTSLDTIASHVESNNFYTYALGGITQQVTSTIDQASSSLGWQSATRPLRVQGGVRVHQMDYLQESSAATTTTKNEGLNANLGASYQFSERLYGSAGSQYNVMRNDSGDVRAHSENANLGYNSERRALGEFDYGWNSGVTAGHSQSEGARAQSAGVSLGHNLNRRWMLEDRSNLILSFNQDVADSYTRSSGTTTTISPTGVDGQTRRLSHSMNLGWSSSDQSGNTLAQLSISDSRGIIGDESSSQMVNAQLSRSQIVDNRSSLTGNLSWQAWHYTVPGTPDYGLGQISTASGSYRYARPFTLQRVTFTSDLRLTESQPAYGAGFQEIFWDNRFTHEIGMMRSSLGLTLREHKGIQSTMLMFSVRRMF